MVKPIMKDETILSIISEPATMEDLQTAQDLLDTLKANAEHCVGMAANMIGISKRIIAVFDEEDYLVLFNPAITQCSEPFETEEGCLSLVGTRKTTRYNSIEVRYQNNQFQKRLHTFKGWTAQIIQHEIDHCNGILI